MQFHEELARIAGNPVVTEALHSIFHTRLESLNSISELFGYKDGIYYHMLILRAIEEGDASRAKQCMRSHIQKAIDDLEFESRAEKEEIEFLKKNL